MSWILWLIIGFVVLLVIIAFARGGQGSYRGLGQGSLGADLLAVPQIVHQAPLFRTAAPVVHNPHEQERSVPDVQVLHRPQPAAAALIISSDVDSDIEDPVEEDPVNEDLVRSLQSSVRSFSRPAARKLTGQSKGERRCREVLEKRYKVKFDNVRPSFLRNPETGRLLEYDCFNYELKLAVEYQGIQHYVYPNYYMDSVEQFTNQLRRDQYTREMADKHGIYLITVPYTVPLARIEDYLIEKLRPYDIATGRRPTEDST